MAMLTINDLSKNYGKIKALDGVSFEVPPKTVFGILGPNGSGKTTLLGIIMDVIKSSGGSFTWVGNGLPPHDLRKKIGTLLETPNFYHYLSAEKNLEIAAKIKGRGEGDIEKVLKLVNLYERRDSKFSTYSLGMKQRLAIAAALLGDPDILVFDEPTNGLDPAGIAEIRELIRELYGWGKTIIMASHILDEVEKVCTHVAILQKGVLRSVSSVAELMDTAHIDDNLNIFIEISAADNEALKKLLQQMPDVVSVTDADNELHLLCNDKVTGEMLNRFCFDNGIVLNKLHVRKKTLEARFLEITGKQSDK
jgi:lantibiotic transport system ATP-binding protein